MTLNDEDRELLINNYLKEMKVAIQALDMLIKE